MVTFVYRKESRGGATTIEYQFKPQYGEPSLHLLELDLLQVLIVGVKEKD